MLHTMRFLICKKVYLFIFKKLKAQIQEIHKEIITRKRVKVKELFWK